MGFNAIRAHYQLTRLAIALGPRNPLIRSLLKRTCKKYGVGLEFSPLAVDIVKGDQIIRISSKHFAYAPSLAKEFDGFFRQVEPTQNGSSLVVDYSGPRIQKYKVSGLEFEINSFPEEDSAIEDYFHWYRPKEGDVIFDLGAYCGVSTYFFSKRVGESGRVYSFEPDESSHALLLRNIERHRLRNVIPLRMAIAESCGKAKFLQEGTLGSVLSKHSSRATMGTVNEVETISLSAACERFATPAFMKMDIEGSEIDVLNSSRDLLRNTAIEFALDTNHWVDGVRTNSEVEQIFIECGYETASSDSSGFMTTWARKPLVASHSQESAHG